MVQFENYEVFTSEDKGRGVRAIQNIAAGEQVITEKPLSCILSNSKYRGVRCDFCYAEPQKLLKCSKCKFTSYCGRNCQAGDWKIHKYECKCLRKSAPRNPPDFCRLVSQLIFRFYCCNDNDTSVCKLDSLYADKTNISNSRKEAFFTFGAVLVEYLSSVALKLEDIDVYGLMCKVSCNSFAITNAELNSLGTGIYATASLFNHCCDPNCIALFNGREIAIRTIKPILKGEELFLSYISPLSTSDFRQLELKESYMFNCKCSVCNGKQMTDFLMKSIKCSVEKCSCMQTAIPISEYASFDKTCSCKNNCSISEKHLSKANICMDELLALYNNIKVVPTIKQQKELNEAISRAEQILGAQNITLLHCYEVAMDGCIDCDDWEGAMKNGIKLENGYKVFLSQFHPTIGLHYFKLGKLAMQLDDLPNGITYLEKSYRVLSVSHGNEHYLVKQLKAYLDQACRQMVEFKNLTNMDRRNRLL